MKTNNGGLSVTRLLVVVSILVTAVLAPIGCSRNEEPQNKPESAQLYLSTTATIEMFRALLAEQLMASPTKTEVSYGSNGEVVVMARCMADSASKGWNNPLGMVTATDTRTPAEQLADPTAMFYRFDLYERGTHIHLSGYGWFMDVSQEWRPVMQDAGGRSLVDTLTSYLVTIQWTNEDAANRVLSKVDYYRRYYQE